MQPQSIRQVFIQHLSAILRPVVRLCLKRMLKFQDFEKIAKSAFLQAAEEEIRKNGAPCSVSRLSVMTGLQRREISQFRKAKPARNDKSNLITRLIGQWVSDRRFQDQRGRPKVLLTEGKNSDFARLVRAVSKDLNHHTILFELERLGVVVRNEKKVRLQVQTHQRLDAGESLSLLAEDTKDLIAAVEENMLGLHDIPNLHARTYYDNIGDRHLPKIRAWMMKTGQRVHAEARKFLSQFDRDINPSGAEQNGDGIKVVLGTFSHISRDSGEAAERTASSKKNHKKDLA